MRGGGSGRILVALCLVLSGARCRGGGDDDWLHSLSSVAELYDSGLDLLIETEKYIQNEYKRLDDIRRFIEQREAQNARELAEAYTESSINAFKTILRIKTDWEMLKNNMAPSTAMDFKNILVTNKDMDSALRALRRLQIIYELEVEELTNGEVGGYTFEKFDVDDCYRMADMCFENVEFHCAYEWFTETHKKYKEDNSTSKIVYEEFITKYIWSSYLIGNIDKARTLIEAYLIEVNYVLNDVLTNVRYVVWNQNPVFKRNTAEDHKKKFYSHTLQKLDKYGDVSSYIAGCQTWWYVSRYLKSRYFYGRSPFLMIGPLQEETVSIIPSIKFYHNVLFDEEIKIIKDLARPELKRLPTDVDEDISLRKVATFQRHNHTVFDAIANRILKISKNKANVLDKFTVTNYGLSGHYLPHVKFIDEDHMINAEGRTAAVIFHLDDVPVGGYTVVPEVYVNVPSIKGSALVIYNTRKMMNPFGGQPMFPNTQYGSCPIFYGDKWTLTAWFLNES